MIPATALPPGCCPGCGRSTLLAREAFAEWWFRGLRSGPFESLLQLYVRLNLCRCAR